MRTFGLSGKSVVLLRSFRHSVMDVRWVPQTSGVRAVVWARSGPAVLPGRPSSAMALLLLLQLLLQGTSRGVGAGTGTGAGGGARVPAFVEARTLPRWNRQRHGRRQSQRSSSRWAGRRGSALRCQLGAEPWADVEDAALLARVPSFTAGTDGSSATFWSALAAGSATLAGRSAAECEVRCSCLASDGGAARALAGGCRGADRSED